MLLKKTSLIIMFTIIVFCGVIAKADSGSCGDGAVWEFNSHTRTLTISGTGDITNYNSSTQKAPWLSDNINNQLEHVVINNGITTIGDYAFYNCTNIQTIQIPNSVTKIGKSSFGKCTSLTNLVIPKNVTSIGLLAFYGCSSLTDISILANISELPNNTFTACNKIERITISESILAFGTSVFKNCVNLSNIFYRGSQEQWDMITNKDSIISNPTIHYNSKDIMLTVTRAEKLSSACVFSFNMYSIEARNGTFIIAVYDDSGRLMSVKSRILTNALTYYELIDIPISDVLDATSYRIFFWDSLEKPIPLCECEAGNL